MPTTLALLFFLQPTCSKVPIYVADRALAVPLGVLTDGSVSQQKRAIRRFSQTHPVEDVTPLTPNGHLSYRKIRDSHLRRRMFGFFTCAEGVFFERVYIRAAAVWTVVRLRRRSPTNRDSSSLLTKTSDTLVIALPATFNEQHNPQTFTWRLLSFVDYPEIPSPCIHLHYKTR